MGQTEAVQLEDKSPSWISSTFLLWTSTMTLSEGEKSLSTSLGAFQPPWRATQRVLGDRGGEGEKVEGQRSTAAKRQTPQLHSSACGRVRAGGPDRRRGNFQVQHQAAKDHEREEVT